MNKFAMVFLTAAMTLGSGAVMAAESGNNGTANQAADAGATAPGAKQNLPPNNVDNSKINNGSSDSSMSGSNMSHDNMSADEVHKNSQCKDGKCPDVNRKVETQTGGGDVNTKTDGTTQ